MFTCSMTAGSAGSEYGLRFPTTCSYIECFEKGNGDARNIGPMSGLNAKAIGMFQEILISFVIFPLVMKYFQRNTVKTIRIVNLIKFKF